MDAAVTNSLGGVCEAIEDSRKLQPVKIAGTQF
jgi:hypothetical protein